MHPRAAVWTRHTGSENVEFISTQCCYLRQWPLVILPLNMWKCPLNAPPSGFLCYSQTLWVLFYYYFYLFWGCVHHGISVEVRGQLYGIGSLLWCEFWESNLNSHAWSTMLGRNPSLPTEPSPHPAEHLKTLQWCIISACFSRQTLRIQSKRRVDGLKT